MTRVWSVTHQSLQWFVQDLGNGHVAIQNPADIFPSRSLSYDGKPEKGDRVIPGQVSDFPTREWRVKIAPQKPLPIPYQSVYNPDCLLYFFSDSLFILVVSMSQTRISLWFFHQKRSIRLRYVCSLTPMV